MAGRIEISWAEAEFEYSDSGRRLRPDGIQITSSWTTDQGGSDLATAVDEVVASDTDYIRSSNGPNNEVAVVSLTDPAGTVDTAQAVTVRYRYGKTGTDAVNLLARLAQYENEADDFNRANEPLETSAKWTKGTLHTDPVNLNIVSNQVEWLRDQNRTRLQYLYEHDFGTVDLGAELTLASFSYGTGDYHYFGPATRFTLGSDRGTGYCLLIDIVQSELKIQRLDNTSNPGIAIVAHTPAAGYKYRLVSGADNMHRAYVDTGSGWQMVLEVFDDTYTNSNKCGIVGLMTSSLGSNRITFDDFKAWGRKTIAEWEHTGIGTSYVTAAQVLTTGEKAAVTDWNALAVEITANPPPFTPGQVSGLLGWYDASDATTLTWSGSQLQGWASKAPSMLELNATPLSGGTFPSGGTRTVNGMPMVQLDGVTEGIFRATEDLGALAQRPSVAVAYDMDTIVAGSQLVANAGSGGSYTRFYWHGAAGFAMGNGSGPSSIPIGQHIGVGYPPEPGGGTTTSTHVDGALTAETETVAAINAPAIKFGFGGYPNNINANHDGAVGEVLVYDHPLSVSERQKIEGYLAHKWGMEANLPAGHPYKASPP